MLHIYPKPVAPRFDHHATAHIRRLREIGRADDLLIPFRKIFLAAGSDRVFARTRGRCCHTRSPEIKPAKMNWRVGNCRVVRSSKRCLGERNNSEPSNKREFIQVIIETTCEWK